MHRWEKLERLRKRKLDSRLQVRAEGIGRLSVNCDVRVGSKVLERPATRWFKLPRGEHAGRR